MNNPSTIIPLDELVGKKLKGQYLLLSKIGQGGMGAVFRSVNESLGKVFAIKVLALQTGNVMNRPEAEARFAREVKLASQMSQSTIAQVFDCGIEYGYPYMVMEFVEGINLDEMIKNEKPIKPTRALEVMRQLALALEEAERCGVVHRDIKPENIKLHRYRPGGPIALKVLDFGLAKSIKDEQDQLTTPGTVMGTVSYMAPEQISPEASSLRRSARALSTGAAGPPPPPLVKQAIDHRADLYSAGVILYYMLAGRLPFAGEMSAVLAAHLFQEPPRLPPTALPQLAAVTYKLLQKEPADRFQSATELIATLQEIAEVTSSGSGGKPTTKPPARLLSALLFGAGLGVAGLAVGRWVSKPETTTVTSDLSVRRPAPDLASPPDFALEKVALPDLAAPLRPPVADMAVVKKRRSGDGKPTISRPVSDHAGAEHIIEKAPPQPANNDCIKDELGSCIIPHSGDMPK